jgi:serine/threonine-protein kinase RsbW
MLAANLAVVCGLSIDEVEDVRMAAEEGFVFASSTDAPEVGIVFTLDKDVLRMTYTLGHFESAAPLEDNTFEYARLILQAVCDAVVLSPDYTQLTLEKALGDAHAN